ncbi:LysR family transcriptional regulator [Pedobacter sp. HDW13]|uniref:LysR family transcriptional regulator n=1 Tax=Pedobacter sp. HDW13 TaxID=2714940 RepID=UPI00140DCA2C|nr:LysR family transcriptional regulator [Pedobacter sp. HDW13]QIL41688.1 LysR family transcriptional regulator [Pedobacter sp. HDW13]
MFDFRLKVFYIVAKRLNFTRAAEELFITQPAVTKHIQEIEAFYKTRLFDRNGTKIKITQAGNILLKHAEALINIHRNIDFELSTLAKNIKGTLRMGASTTIAQYFLPKYLASFRQQFPDITVSLKSNNTEAIENLLIENKIDLGLVEGQSKRPHIKYTPFVQDEIVLCTSNTNPMVKKTTISLGDLQKLPLVLREPGSGSLEVVAAALKNVGLSLSQLNRDLELESAESIKAYLLNTNAFAFLSIHAILKELKSGELKVVDVKGLDITRVFYFITQQGDTPDLQEIFIKHLASHNLKL